MPSRLLLYTRLAAAIDAGNARLNEDATWTKISASEQDTIKRTVGLVTPTPLSIGTDPELQRCLDRRPLAGWLAEIDAIESRVSKALEAAATLLETAHPEVATAHVTVRRGTLTDAAEVQAWIEEHGKKLREAVANGPVIVS